jgi:hypothetical protein
MIISESILTTFGASFIFFEAACEVEEIGQSLKSNHHTIGKFGLPKSLKHTVTCVSEIVTWVGNLLSQLACVFRRKYQTDKYLLHHKVMLPHPFYHSAIQFHNTYPGWTNQCIYNKNACMNRLWQHDF